MPDVSVNGVRLHYTDSGSGAEVVVFSHSYLVDLRQYAHQLEALSGRYRVIAYDHRGHGGSDAPPGSWSMEDIYRDGLGLLEALSLPPVHWVGLSTGGFVGQRIAIRAPERLRSLSLLDTAAQPEPLFNRVKYNALFGVLRVAGFGPVTGSALSALFGATFLRDPHREAERALWRTRLQSNDIDALIRFGQAIFGRQDVSAQLGAVRCPTLVMVGEEDRATPPSRAQHIASAIPGARLEIIPAAGHLSTIEQPERVTSLLTSFLASVP